MNVRPLIRECVEQVHGELIQEHARRPTMEELMEMTGLSRETIRRACAELGLKRARKRRGRKPGATA